MKNYIKFLFAAIIAASLAGCDIQGVDDVDVNGNGNGITFTASLEASATRTQINGGKVTWEVGDKIAVTDGTTKEVITLADANITDDGAKATFTTTTLSNTATYFYAVYPEACFYAPSTDVVKADENAMADIKVHLYAYQYIDKQKAAVAVCENTGSRTFSFKNVSTLFKFETEIPFKLAVLSGNNNEPVLYASSIIVNPSDGIKKSATNSGSSINYFPQYSFSSNYVYGITHYIATATGVELNDGFKITLYDGTDARTANVLGEFIYRKPITTTRNKIFNIKNFDSRVDALFYESFDKCESKGGNDGSFVESSNTKIEEDTASDYFDCSWSVYNNVYPADGCVKLGSSSAKGQLTTSSISLTPGTNYTLTFKAGAWNANTEATTINVSVDNASVSQSSINIAKGAFTDCSIVIYNVTASPCKITFAASQANKNRFFLDEVKIVKGGETPTISVTGVSLNKTTERIYLGETKTLEATIAPIDATNHQVSWSSSDENVATVSDGVVTPVASGEATITVTTEDGNFTADCVVTVINPQTIQSLTISQFIGEADTDQEYKLSGWVSDYTFNSTYNNADFTLNDEYGSSILIYRIPCAEGQIHEGDEVVLSGFYNSHNNAPEVVNGHLIEVHHYLNMSLSRSAVSFGAAGGDETVTVTYWDNVGEVLISANTEEGPFVASASGNTITITAAPNTTTSPINGTISVFISDNSGTTAQLSIAVTQEGAVDSNAYGTVTYDFTTGESIEALGIVLPASNNGTALAYSTPYTLAPISMTAVKNGASTDTRIWHGTSSGYDLRMYASATLTFTSSASPIVKIVFTGDNVTLTPNGGNLVSKTWTGSAMSVTFTAGGTNRISTIEVTYGTPSLQSLSWTGYTSTYTVGATFSVDGTITAVYSNAPAKELSASDVTIVTSPDLTAAGSTTAKISYTENGTTVEATANITVEEAHGQTVVLSEEFDNSSTSDSSTAITNTTFSNFSGETSKAYKSQYGGIKLGASNAAGYITSKSLDLSRPFTVTLNVLKYGSDTGNVEVTVNGVKKTITPTSTDTQYTLSFSAATSTSTVKIGTSAKRAYIDNVIVTVN